MDEAAATDPHSVWPEVADWHPVGMHEPVYRVRTASGVVAYVRPDDGSSALLRRLADAHSLPSPRVLDAQRGWLLLSALPGVPLHDDLWLRRPVEAAAIATDALCRLEAAGIRHGDMCLPNILGDPETARLSGIVDWRYADRYDREIDVASAVWSCGFNGYGPEVATAILTGCGWRRTDAAEVDRLREVWTALCALPDPNPGPFAVQ